MGKLGKKPKVGILTLYHKNYNFGGLLQAYALPCALKENLGVEAEQIDYMRSNPPLVPTSSPEPDSGMLLKCYQSIYEWVWRLAQRICEKRYFIKRTRAFDCFIQEIAHSQITYDADTIQNSLTEYQRFVCGSDQIWNTELIGPDIEVYTLQFVPENHRKIAYAPSVAVPNIVPDFVFSFQNGLKGLDAISVREKDALPLLKKLTDQKIEVVVDPVLLLTENQWSEVARGAERKRKYILCYLLGDSTGQRSAATRFSRRIRRSILTFPHIIFNCVRKSDLFFGDIHDYTSGPREFLSLIKNADFVITDSFHACVFSMIFETPFVVFERHREGEKGNMNSRIYDFLEEYHLESQLVTEEKLVKMQGIPKIDYTYAHAHWKKRREESLEYLANALKDN